MKKMTREKNEQQRNCYPWMNYTTKDRRRKGGIIYIYIYIYIQAPIILIVCVCIIYAHYFPQKTEGRKSNEKVFMLFWISYCATKEKRIADKKKEER